MKLLFKFLSRIVGLKHISFTTKGVFLFDFPMFLLDIKFYPLLVDELSKVLGKSKAHKIFYDVGFIQGYFAVEYFKKKYNIAATKKDFDFYLEQTQSLGLGRTTLKNLDVETPKLVIENKPSTIFPSKHYDYYLEGLMASVYYDIFDVLFSISHKKVSSSSHIYELIPNSKIKDKDLPFLKTYTYSSLISSPINKEPHPQFLKMKRLYRNPFYSCEEGTFFGQEKYFFTLLSVFVSIYYKSILENSKCKKVYYDLGREYGKILFDRFKFLFSRKKLSPEFFSLLSLVGFGENFRIIKLNNTSLKLQLSEGNFETIAKKLFLKNYSILNNDFTFGIVEGIFSSMIGKEKLSFSLIEKKNYVILELKV